MTTATRPVVTGDTEALRLLRQGVDSVSVSELTDVPLSRVQALRAQVVAEGNGTPAVTSRAVPAPVAVPRTGQDVDPVQRLLTQAVTGTYGKRTANLAARIATDVDKLRDLLAQQEAKVREQAERKEREAKARAEVERLEQQLREAKAKLRRPGTAVSAAKPRTPAQLEALAKGRAVMAAKRAEAQT